MTKVKHNYDRQTNIEVLTHYLFIYFFLIDIRCLFDEKYTFKRDRDSIHVEGSIYV